MPRKGVRSLPERLACPQLRGDPRCPGLDGRPIAEVAGRQVVPRGGGQVPHEALGKADGWRVRVAGAEEDLLTSRVQHLRELVELLRPAGIEDVLTVLVQ